MEEKRWQQALLHVQPAGLKLGSSWRPAGAAGSCWKDLLPSTVVGRSAKMAPWPPPCPVARMALIKQPELTEKEQKEHRNTRSSKHAEALKYFFFYIEIVTILRTVIIRKGKQK